MRILRKILGLPVWLLGLAFFLLLAVGNIGAPMFSKSINLFLGFPTHELVSPAATPRFASAYDTAEAQYQASAEVARNIEAEGIVLLRNEGNALPLSGGAKVTLLGQDSVDFVYGGAGSGSIDASSAATLREALEQAALVVNPVAWDFYESGPGKGYRKVVPDITGAGGFAVNEVPAEEFTDELRASFADYADAAIVTIGRTGSESTDLPADYLKITEEELATGAEALANFDKVIVLLNSSNAIELDPLIDAGVDAILLVSSPGQAGIEAIGDVIAGKLSPSGRLVDTYAADVFSAPAMSNLGDYTITNSNVTSGNKYLVYAEGIYVGYRYYETRYEDVVLGQGNAGDFDYDAEVVYPFGHGLSYTSFERSNFQVKSRAEAFDVHVTITNKGATPGKEVVQVYLQKPYKADAADAVEASAIELAGFAKTRELAPGESQEVNVTIPREVLRSYSDEAGAYVTVAGSYYLALGDNAHDALNNVLAAKGKRAADGMDADGDAALAYKHDEAKATTDDGAKSAFADVDIRTYDPEFEYLSRADWKATMPSSYAGGSWEAPEELLAALEVSYEDDPSAQMPEFGLDNGLTLAALVGADADDPRWDQLVSQMSKQELWDLVRKSGYLSDAIPSIGMPSVPLKDGPAGISATLMGGNISCMSYPVEVVLASTWNTELAREMGQMVGEDSIAASTPVWYAPAMNIHRTAISGRNFEYYSEDGLLSGAMAAAECAGASEKGLIVTIKHFAVNDQEINRYGGAYFANEQSLREVFLRGFEGAVRDGGAKGVMVSMNRIGPRWTGGHAGLMTDVLRGEWGFEGFATTDQATFPTFAYADIREGLEAGTDMWLNAGDIMFNENVEQIDATTWSRVREAAKRILFQYANSNALNNVDENTQVKAAFPMWQLLRVGVSLAAAALAYGCFKLSHVIAGTRTLWQTIRRKPKKGGAGGANTDDFHDNVPVIPKAV